MPIRLSDLISRVPRDVEKRVRRVREKQISRTIQDALRAECRLLFRTTGDTDEASQAAQVPIVVAPGHPAALDHITFPDDFATILLLAKYRQSLEQTAKSLPPLTELRRSLAGADLPQGWLLASETDLSRVQAWASTLLQALDKHDPLKIVLAVEDDCLGVYQYDASDLHADETTVNKANIQVYWGVIGLVSEWAGCSVEDLTMVVLTHELAHAYTQLGADIQGWRWPAHLFAKCENDVKEGLAQYYTYRVLDRLKSRHPGALKAFQAILPAQPPPYHTHEPWLENDSPEAVRLAMLEFRRWKETTLNQFNSRLAQAEQDLHPGATPKPPSPPRP